MHFPENNRPPEDSQADAGKRPAPEFAFAQFFGESRKFAPVPFSPRRFGQKAAKNIIAGGGMICGVCTFGNYERYREIEGE